MSVWVVTSKFSGHIVAIYSSYTIASKKWDINQFDIQRWNVEIK